MSQASILAAAVNAYAAFLAAGKSYGSAMREAAQSLGGTPCPTFLGQLAKVHADKYECSYTWDGKGRAVFYNGKESTRETRNDAARKSWSRNVMVWFREPAPAKPASSSQRVDPAIRKVAMAFLAEFKGETLGEQISAAMAVLKAMK